MYTFFAIFFSIALVVISVLIDTNYKEQIPVAQLMVVLTSIWAAIDSSNIQLRKYKTNLSYSPFGILIACLMLWIISFPWYLIVRHDVKTGKAPLLKEGEENKMQAVRPVFLYILGFLIGLPVLFIAVLSLLPHHSH